MRRIIQPDEWSCLAACACMITGEPIQALYADVGHDGSEIVEKSQGRFDRRAFHFCEITRYLAGQGFNLGAPSPAPDAVQYRPDLHLPALLIVQGRNHNHAVIWDGYMVLDPAAHAGEVMFLDSYHVKQWWPIVNISREGL